MATGSIKKQTFVTQKITYNYTASGSGNVSINLYAMATLQGYEPVGIIEYATGAQGVYAVNVSVENSNFGVFLHNSMSSTQTGTFSATVLYQKS